MILFALNLAGNRVYIENAHSGTIYLCEECGTKLVPKNHGTERQHHFAHKPDANNIGVQRDCQKRSDLRTKNQMSAWHQAWQKRFPENQREIVFKKDGLIFRADVCCEARHEIIEFQHSRITSDDFCARNSFYNSLGYKVIWLFDFDEFTEQYKYVFPENYDEFIKRFIRPGQTLYSMDVDFYRSMFGEWKPQKNRNVSVCFMHTYQQRRYYDYIQCVTGRLDNGLPMHLFTIQIKERAFLRRIGAK